MNILFICQELHLNVPRSIRVSELSKNNIEHNITLLYFDHESNHLNEPGLSKVALTFGPLMQFVFFRDFYKKRTKYHWINKIVGVINFLYDRINVLDHWSLSHSKIVQFVENARYDAVVISIAPFSNFLLSQKLRRAGYAGQIVLDIGDPLSQNAASSSTNFKQMQVLEESAIKFADKLIVTNFKTKDFYKENLRYKNPIGVYPNGFAAHPNFYPQSITVSFKQKISAVYAGAIYQQLRPIDDLLSVIAQKPETVDITVIASHKPALEAPNIFWHPRMTPSELMSHYERANVLIYIDNTTGIQTSSKIFELLAIGKPLVFLYTFESENYLFAKSFPWVFFVRNDFQSILHFFERAGHAEQAILSPEYSKLKRQEWNNIASDYLSFIENS